MAQVYAGEQASRFIRFGTAGAVAYTVAFPLAALSRIVSDGIDQGKTFYAVIATACLVPLQAWLVFAATRGRTPGWLAGAAGVLVIGGLPVIGVGWIGALYGLAAVVLIGVRPPWSFVLFVAVMAAPAPLAYGFGHPEYALYFTIGLPFVSVPVAVVVWLIRAARQLQAARLTLADEAVIGERLRIDVELRRTVGATLAEIVEMGERLGSSADTDPQAGLAGLRTLAGVARGTMADARRLVTRYQRARFGSELRAAVSLLSAAGIRARLAMPPGDLPETIDPAQRAALRDGLARLLRDDTDIAGVTITVIPRGGGFGIELSRDEAGAARETAS